MTPDLTARTLASLLGVDPPTTEYRFAPPRRWRFDYCWVQQKVALEVEGGIWTGGRHTRGSGFAKDIVKYNEAEALDYYVIKCTPSTIFSNEIIETLRRCLEKHNGIPQ